MADKRVKKAVADAVFGPLERDTAAIEHGYKPPRIDYQFVLDLGDGLAASDLEYTFTRVDQLNGQIRLFVPGEGWRYFQIKVSEAI